MNLAQGKGRLGRLERAFALAEPIIRLILDGTVVRVRLDKKATSISLLVALGVRQDGQKVLPAINNMAERARPPRGHCSTISSIAD